MTSETEQGVHVTTRRAMEEAGETTLAELLDPVWRRDSGWDISMGCVLRKALKGWQLIWEHGNDVEADFGSLIYRTNNGTVFIDELVRIAWIWEQYEADEESKPTADDTKQEEQANAN